MNDSVAQLDETPRRSGVLLHVTSLPSRYGVGDLGTEAVNFIRDLAGADQSYWQMLPVVPTGFADSPYQSPSAFAGNPMLISPEHLVDLGLVTPDDIQPLTTLSRASVDFRGLLNLKTEVLAKAAAAFPGLDTSLNDRFAGFREKHGPTWLEEASLFAAIKDSLGGAAWNEWPRGLALRDPDALQSARELLGTEIETYQILQFLFSEQWETLRQTARAHRIELVGDIPLYVAHDSADVWANPQSFLLDSDRNPTVVAGVPPDYFSETGQRWGNPIYDWAEMEADGFGWWRDRLARVLELFDVVRIDHFRGIAGYWAIPAEEPTAVVGEWLEGPGAQLIEAVGIETGDPSIIAEDLGIITDDVIALRDGYELPGMRVAQFGFDDAPDTPLHHPDAYTPDVWAYTGTHDNNTTEGWFWEGNPGRDKSALEEGRKELYDRVGEPVVWGLIEMIADSPARTAIVPAQDLLGLGKEARMNTPGTTEGNWRWRLHPGQIGAEALDRLSRVTRAAGRVRSTSR